MATKTYRAIATGFDGNRIIKAGELFTTEIPKGSWMELVETAPDKPAKAKPAAKAKADD